MLKEIGIRYEYKFDDWFSKGEYHFEGSNIWDSARRLSPDMYISPDIRVSPDTCVSPDMCISPDMWLSPDMCVS